MKANSRLLILMLLLILVAIIITYGVTIQARKENTSLEYRDIAAIFTACIVCGTLLITTINTQINQTSNKDKISIDREKLAFDKAKYQNDKKVLAYNLFDGYNNPVMIGYIKNAYEFQKTHTNLHGLDLAIEIDKNFENRAAVSYLLNYLEKVAVSYKEDIGDKELIKELFIDVFKVHFQSFEEYIKIRRIRVKSDNVFDTFEAINKQWNHT